MEKRIIKKFGELNLNEEFSMPDYQWSYSRQFIKLSEVSYACLITKLCYWADKNLNVEVVEPIKENEDEKIK